MLVAFLLFGTIILVITAFILYRIRYLKLSIYIMLFISLTLYSYLIFRIVNEGEQKLVRQEVNGDSLPNAKASEKISDERISFVKLKEKVLLDVPIIKQFPELPRGCEVTSLAMLLQYKGIQTDKMDLAAKVKKDSTPYRKVNGNIHWGSPNDGFIGDMYSYSNRGYGVYHKPIKELAEQFLPGQIVDLTGRDFAELKTFLSLDIPIWIITNTTYKKLPETAFETWQTPDGEIQITYKEHSVLITGYDGENIYFNDPINGEKNRAARTEDFIDAWKQMGSQAVTYLPEEAIEK